jgi:hypothetical protein
MTKTLRCPHCNMPHRFDQIQLVSGTGTDTKTYIKLYCRCRNIVRDKAVMMFVVDLTPEFDRQEASPCQSGSQS